MKKTPQLQAFELEQSLKEFMFQLPSLMGYYTAMSPMLKTYYDALVDVGFTEAQALEIIKAHGIFPGGVGKINAS